MRDFVEEFDASIPDYWKPHPRPTDESLRHIARHFDVTLPPELVELSRRSNRFANVFLSFGENYEDFNHVIAYNSYWRRRRRTRRIPSELVIFTNGFMDEDFWCLVRDGSVAIGSVEFWSPAPIGFPGQEVRGLSYSTFPEFLTMLVAHHRGSGADA